MINLKALIRFCIPGFACFIYNTKIEGTFKEKGNVEEEERKKKKMI